MVKYLLLVIISLGLSSVSGQEDQVAAINRDFDTYRAAVIANDYAKVVSLMHPRIVKMGGGTEYMIEDIEQDVNMYSAIGVSIIDIQAKQPSMIVEAGQELHAMLPVEFYAKTPVDTTREDNFLLTASQDGGETWYFVDMRKQDAESIQYFIPDYNTRLNYFLKEK